MQTQIQINQNVFNMNECQYIDDLKFMFQSIRYNT